jgi:hypothetical protein
MQGVSLLLLYVVVNSSFLKIEVAAFQSGKPSTRAASKPCSPARCSTISRVPRCAVGMSGNEEEETAPEGEDSDDSEPIFKNTVRIDDGGSVRIDDGGSDLTDRFKYKVHALMGTYNPQAGTDDERQDGNILNGKHWDNEIIVVRSNEIRSSLFYYFVLCMQLCLIFQLDIRSTQLGERAATRGYEMSMSRKSRRLLLRRLVTRTD